MLDQIQHFLSSLYNSAGLMPYWNCGQWTAPYVWLYALGNLSVFLAYLSLGSILLFFVIRRHDLPFSRIFLLFAALILASGFSYFLDAGIFWWPIIQLDTGVLFLTAVLAWITLLQVVPVFPKVQTLKTPSQMETLIQERTNALRESMRELSNVRNALDEGVILAITDRQGTITHVNDAFCRISKYTADELIGQNHRIINSGYHSHDFFKNMWATISHGQVWKGEIRNRAKDGSLYWVDTTIVPFLDEDGQPYQYVALRHDITERKRVEQELVNINRELENRVTERTYQLEAANRQLERRVNQHAVIAELGQAALSGKPLPEMMTSITHRIAEALEVEYGLVAKYIKDHNRLIAEAGYGWQDWVVGQANIEAIPTHQTGYTLLFNEPIIVEDFRTETRFKRSFLLTPHNILSGISVTIGDKANPYGVLDAFATAPRVFSEDDITFIQSAGNMLAMAIERKNAEEAVRASEERYRLAAEALGEKTTQLRDANEMLAFKVRQHQNVSHVGQMALSGMQPSALHETIPRLVAETLGVECVLIGQFFREENYILVVAGHGWQDWVVGQLKVPATPEFQSGYTMLNNKPIIVEDFSQETRFHRSEVLIRHNILSSVTVTIGSAEKQYGVLDAFSTRTRSFTGDDVVFIQSVANILGMAIERKNAEEAVRASEERYRLAAEALGEKTTQLEAINKELESFSYSVSHDLRAPLRSIDGFSKLVIQTKADQLDEEGRNFLERVCRSSQQMGFLIDDLLNLSRLSRAELQRQTVDLSRMGRDILEGLHIQNPERQVETYVEDGMTANADPVLMRAVLDNLLGNAWKFSSKREKSVIEFGSSEQTKGKTVFFIRDNGAGFDMAYAGKLFGAFQRLHNQDEFPGTGIGLATVQRILHRHGGAIRAEGAVDQGATFYFSL